MVINEDKEEETLDIFLNVYEVALELGSNHEDAVEVALEAIKQEEEE